MEAWGSPDPGTGTLPDSGLVKFRCQSRVLLLRNGSVAGERKIQKATVVEANAAHETAEFT